MLFVQQRGMTRDMKKANIKRNYFFTLIYQVFSLIIPLVTTPYISRVLLSEGVGKYGFSASINSYFCIFAALGFSVYGQREVAKKHENKEEQSEVFWEIFICKVLFGGVSLSICWLLVGLGVFGEYSVLVKLMSLEIISIALNIVYYFQGNEKFGLIAFRDFIIKFVGVISIFCFVKTKDDLWIYALCNGCTALLSAFSLWFCLKKDIVAVKISRLRPFKHLLPSLKLFIPTVAISIYTILDKTLIGILIPGEAENFLLDGSIEVVRIADVENGYYVQAEKIIKISMMVLASLGTVMMPRNAKELADGNDENFRKNIKNAIDFSLFIGAPMAFGIMSIANNFSPWFFGDEFEKVPVLLMIFSGMVLPAGIGNVLGQQYLIPKGEDGKYVFAYIISAMLNLLLNIIMIPSLLSYGAAIATVAAEWCAPILMFIFLRKEMDVRAIFRDNWQPLFAAVVMFIIVHTSAFFFYPSIVSTFILVIEGVVVYIACIFIFKYKVACEIVKRLRIKIIGGKHE